MTMSEQDKVKENKQPAEENAEQFFREIEIEFLVHELKDPIAIIETGLRTLLERQDKFGTLSPRQENTLKRTLRNSKKARELLHNLLEIGRSESGCFIGERPMHGMNLRNSVLTTIKPKPLSFWQPAVFLLKYHRRQIAWRCFKMKLNCARLSAISSRMPCITGTRGWMSNWRWMEITW
jgi:signal transduction histidine kinase